MCPRMFTRTDNGTNLTELNHMQYVCRQLYAETSLLGPGHSSSVAYPRRKDVTESASLTCGRYFEKTKDIESEALRNVHIYKRVPYGATEWLKGVFDFIGMSNLVILALAHPDTTNTVYLDCFNHELEDCWYGCLADHIFVLARKTYDPRIKAILAPGTARWALIDAFAGELAQVWPGYARDAAPFPENVKLMLKRTGPSDEENWVDAQVRRTTQPLRTLMKWRWLLQRSYHDGY